MSSKVVIGLAFGDEGKGITTDYLCSHATDPLVVRFSGGHQAGHCVHYNGIKHVFSNFGSGTLRGTPTYWSRFCTIDPVGILNERNVLAAKGIIPKLYIDERCPITTPFDKEANRQRERRVKYGSCGVGFGETIEREENHYSLLFSDLWYPSIFRIKLQQIEKYYKVKDMNFYLKNTGAYTDFISCCYELIKTPGIFPVASLRKIAFTDLIFEGSQGLLLDQNIGFFPHVTRSNTGFTNLHEFPLDVDANTEIFLVTRAYQTRHGNGPMTNEDIPHNIKSDVNEINIYHEYQGSFRRSLLDIDLLRYAITHDEAILRARNKNLVITCMDHVEDELRYTSTGEIYTFSDKEQFAHAVAGSLAVRNIYVSNSPESSNIIKYS